MNSPNFRLLVSIVLCFLSLPRGTWLRSGDFPLSNAHPPARKRGWRLTFKVRVCPRRRSQVTTLGTRLFIQVMPDTNLLPSVSGTSESNRLMERSESTRCVCVL
uniref:Putative secreted protein n=1 Tax=Anopheles triannulatus TaxID=58253 RepID=A0A2M4B5N9_9DIPT